MSDFTDSDKLAIAQTIQQVRDEIVSLWSDAVGRYKALQYARATLGLPGTDDPTDPNGWSPEDEQKARDAEQMVTLAVQYANDALDGKRRIGYDAATGDIRIEALPDDQYKVDVVPGQGPVVMTTDGTVVHSSGAVGEPVTIGTIVIVAVGVLGAVAIAYVAYLAIKELCAWLTVREQQQAMVDLQQNCTNAVANKSMTVDQCQTLTTNIQAEQQKIIEAQAKAKCASDGGTWDDKTKSCKPKSPVADTLTTIAWVALGIAALGTVVYTIQTFTGGPAVAPRRSSLPPPPPEPSPA